MSEKIVLTKEAKSKIIEKVKRITKNMEERAQRHIETNNKNLNPSEYGHWSKGYWEGYASAVDSFDLRLGDFLGALEVQVEEVPKKEKLDMGFCLDCRHSEWSWEDECCYCNKGNKREYVERYGSCEEFDRR